MPSVAAIAPTIVLLLMAGCAGTVTRRDINLRDDGIIMPSLRTDIGFGRARDENGRKTGRFGFTAEATGAEGEPSPTSEYLLLSLQGLGRFRVVNEPRVKAQLLFGFELLAFDGEERLGVTFSRDSRHFGPAIGLDFGVRIFEPLEIYTRATVAELLADANSTRSEIGLRAEMSRHVDLFAAYRHWKYKQDDISLLGLSGLGDLELRTAGVVIGMGLRF